MGYKTSIIINHSIDKVFKAFIDLNKIELPKFNKSNPKETTYKKVVKQVRQRKIEMLTEITEYEKDELYEVTNTIEGDKYITRYEFKKVSEEETEILILEKQEASNIITKGSLLLQKLFAKKRLKEKSEGLREYLTREIDRRYKNQNNNIEEN
ncbi:DUF3284 domain-containing protein [Clostridium sp.]|uniref:DUF3284 domain-containing protein n=1 Tax=Clostridium sp. TaxID=1506 RepID=UPI002620F1B7|nr:DUF3284 domain-containing protein [Clostridium sp.]